MSVEISDHALVRFLDRVGGLDVEAVRLMMSIGLERAMAAAELLGETNRRVQADGMVYVITNGRCVTVKPRGPR